MAADFVKTAEVYGRIIIAEFDPLIYSNQTSAAEKARRISRLTIKPHALGGIAGGVKYLHSNILFKFALDWERVYRGNDEWAMKSANLELKGLRCLEWASIPGLCYPLFAVIKLNGYVLTAQSLVRMFFLLSKFIAP